MEFAISINTIIQLFLFVIGLTIALIHILYKKMVSDIEYVNNKTMAVEEKVTTLREEFIDSFHETESNQMVLANSISEKFMKKEDCDKKHTRHQEAKNVNIR